MLKEELVERRKQQEEMEREADRKRQEEMNKKMEDLQKKMEATRQTKADCEKMEKESKKRQAYVCTEM